DLRRVRSRLRQGGDEGHARHLRPGRRLLRQCRHRWRRTARLHRPYGGRGRRMFATNLDGVFHVFQVAARHMTERAEAGDRFGRLVATSSMASLFGTARNEHYAGTKAALNALCRALAVELARHGVTANAILPGWIKSDMTAGIMGNEKFVANVMPRIPVRRFGEPTDFGGIAVYIMSKASSYHTADCFVIDGGYTAF